MQDMQDNYYYMVRTLVLSLWYLSVGFLCLFGGMMTFGMMTFAMCSKSALANEMFRKVSTAPE